MGLSNYHVAKLNDLKTQVEKLFGEASVIVERFSVAASGGQIPDERDVADGAYICKAMHEMMDDLRKSLKTAGDNAQRWACEQWTIKQIQGVVKDDTIRGQITTAKTSVKSVPKVPKKEHPDYRLLCKDLGLSDELLDLDVFHVHWPGIVDLCTARLRAGLPLPAGIDPYLTKSNGVLEFQEKDDSALAMRKAKG